MHRSISFYDEVFGAFDVEREVTTTEWTQYGRPGETGKICLTIPFDKRLVSGGNGAMLAFKADDYKAVETFHSAALQFGGPDEDAPGIHKDTHYVAYVRGPNETNSVHLRHNTSIDRDSSPILENQFACS